jgi:glycosyl transferase family 11
VGSSPTARTTIISRGLPLLQSSHPIVGVKLMGGLGNQMSQYAAAMLVSRRDPNAEIRVNLSSYETPGYRKVGLGAFGIPLVDYRPKWWRVQELIDRGTNGMVRIGSRVFVERRNFEPVLFELRPPCHLRGYFHSWRYLEPIADRVRARYDTETLRTDRTAELEQQIARAACPVAVHVRRGDYGGDIFTLLQRDYYDRGRERIAASQDAPTYFLFSDDIAQAQELLAGWPNVVPVARLDTLEDFRLMSLCRHFIIGNSTFSWWAAWLGRAADKVVVAPARWFGPGHRGPFDLEALLPPDWVRV